MGIYELMHECQLKMVNIYSGSFWLFECEGSEGTKSVFANEWNDVNLTFPCVVQASTF